MGLESSPTYISDLNSAWPLGTDAKSAGDDHLRNVKSTLLATFPSVTGAVTATHAELNQLDGAASGAGMVSDIAALADPAADRLLFWDDSAGAVGALAPDGTSIAISGTTLATGSNVPLLNAANVFTSSPQTIKSTGAIELWNESGGSGLKRWVVQAEADGDFSIFTRTDAGSAIENAIVASRNASSQVTSIALTADTVTINGGTAWHSGNDGAASGLDADTVDGSQLSALVQTTGDQSIAGTKTYTGTLAIGSATISGALTTPHSTATEVGYQGAPSRDITDTGNTAASDAGKTIRMTSGASKTFTLDSDPPEDSVVILDNASGNAWTIAAGSSLVWAATGGTGSRTLANGGMAVALHQGAGVWKISGGGLS